MLEFILGDECSIGFDQDDEDVESASAEFNRRAVGEQSPPVQWHPEAPEPECRLSCSRARPTLGDRGLGEPAALAGAHAAKYVAAGVFCLASGLALAASKDWGSKPPAARTVPSRKCNRTRVDDA
jgi:hypothetical protein